MDFFEENGYALDWLVTHGALSGCELEGVGDFIGEVGLVDNV